MKITVIGSWGAYPGPGEATSAYLLEEGETKILLDCGSGVVSLLQKDHDLASIDAVVLSHYHHDHIADIGILQYSRVVDMNLDRTDQPLHIYAHQDDEQAFQQLGKKPYAEAFAYNDEEPLIIGPFTFSFHKTTHPAPCYGMKVQSPDDKLIVYTADTTYDETFIPFLQNADLLISECSFYEKQDAAPYGHMNSKEAATLAEKGQVKQLILSHLPHFGTHEQLVKEAAGYYTGCIHLAKVGLTVTLN
ncbi:ribonuclease BN (tRNA processing enzyme) [Evansella vedderi]|uniref:Ribonuclease BN (tRNA processing enzyme) n=1 Tax=Evansella vedderi TaxID=38282 RepID=A0ABU0A2E6_9BACI|nr:MBL fold metallo-hydrolase [Evansella vedderi]MDQ0256525.1 ribonuclease BN (tRNA processing enzyme) [Evansella vedderi]